MNEKITDDRILTILKAVACEITDEYPGGGLSCAFEPDEPDSDDQDGIDFIHHRPGCPTTLARDILRDAPQCLSGPLRSLQQWWEELEKDGEGRKRI